MNPLTYVGIVVFLFGALLLLIAVLGGGFEVRELKVPKVTWMPRLLSAGVGAVFVLVGISVAAANAGTSPAAGTTAAAGGGATPRPSPAVQLSLNDQLGDLQVRDHVTITVEGQAPVNLDVDTSHPTSTVRLSLAAPGEYRYSARSDTVFDIDGSPVEVLGSGSGAIRVVDGSEFGVYMDVTDLESTGQATVSLQGS